MMTKQKAHKSSPSPSSSSGKCDIDLKELTALSFGDLPILDRPKVMPRYSAILKRQSEDAPIIGLEDLDSLQLELEGLLTHVTLRKLSLKNENNMLTHIEKYKGQEAPQKRSGLVPEKRSNSGPMDAKPSKKLKALSSSSGKPSMPKQQPQAIFNGFPKVSKSRNESTTTFDPLQNEQIRPLDPSKPPVPKNETPSRFWAFVEPYCAPISEEEMKLLEDLIQIHDDNLSEYYRIPPLGEHYASRWTSEDFESERLKGSAEEESGGENAGGTLPKVDSIPKESPAFYDLTQRLVAGLMEVNVMMPVEENMDAQSNSKEHFKKLSEGPIQASNPKSLEARVRKELEDQGILEKKCTTTADGSSDEVLEELQRCQIELKALSAHNIKQLKRIHQAAKTEVIRQDLRKKLREVDNDVMEAYKKISIARSKKKPPTKKEKEFAWKALKERDVILKRLESI